MSNSSRRHPTPPPSVPRPRRGELGVRPRPGVGEHDPEPHAPSLRRGSASLPPYTPPSSMGPVAVVDVGSNSGRVVVLRPATGGHLEAIADGRAPLRLA